MKTKILLLIPALMLMAACSQKHKVLTALEEHIGTNCDYYVLALKTGNDLTFPVQPVKTHGKGLTTSGGVLENGIVQTNRPIYYGGSVYFTECTGCDSCMQCYADAGLLKYNVKSRTGTKVIADVELTGKGKKYLLSSLNSAVTENGGRQYLKDYEEHGIRLVVVHYSTPVKAKILQKIAENRYYCEAGTQDHVTPFLTALGGNIDESAKVHTKKYAVYYTEYTDEDGEKRGSVGTEEGFYACGLRTDDSYSLDEYKSLENILKNRYSLTDTIATYHQLTAYNGKITQNGKEIDTGDSMPDWFSSSIIDTDDSGWIFYVVGSSYTFDKIIDIYDWQWSDTEVEGAHEAWQKEDWKMKEVIFKMTRHCSPYDRNINDFGSDKIEWYGRCPYIEIDGTVFFPLLGLWASSKNAVKKGQYGYILKKPQPEESINLPATAFGTVGLTKPFTEIFPASE